MKIIVVDDDKNIRTLISRTLTNAGHEVVEFASPRLYTGCGKRRRIQVPLLRHSIQVVVTKLHPYKQAQKKGA